MFLRLKNNGQKMVNAEAIASEEGLKRGAIVDHLGKKAVANENFAGIAVRGEMVDERVAMGLKADVFADSQDAIANGAYFGIEPIYVMEEYATTEFDTVTVTSETEAKKTLSVENGKLKVDTSTGIFQGLGFRTLPGSDKKFLAFRRIK